MEKQPSFSHLPLVSGNRQNPQRTMALKDLVGPCLRLQGSATNTCLPRPRPRALVSYRYGLDMGSSIFLLLMDSVMWCSSLCDLFRSKTVPSFVLRS